MTLRRKPLPRRKRALLLLDVAAAKTWHDKTVAFGCAVCPKLGRECEGPIQAHHILPRQFIMDWISENITTDHRAEVERELLWDTKNGMGLCYRAHRRHHNRTEPIPRSLVPKRAWDFARRLNLERRLEQAYPDYDYRER